MGMSFDFVVRRGLVVDGSGNDPFEADVAVSQGRIAAIGSNLGRGKDEIDAKDLLVTPGFVDVHTHYDAQAAWENRLSPSSDHGVTTAIMGNDGLGFAPCRPEGREYLVRLAEGIANVPRPVLVEGLPWAWETFPEYLDFLAGRQFDLDLGVIIPHGPLRLYVMGQRAIDLEIATDDDIAGMAAHVCSGIAAGALGVSTSLVPGQRSSDGKLTPTLAANEHELIGLALALKAQGAGLFEFVGDVAVDHFELLRRLAEQSGRPVTFAMAELNQPPFVAPELLDRVTRANGAGLVIRPQMLPHAFGAMLGHEVTLNPFFLTGTYRNLAGLPLQQKIVELRRPEVRARIVEEAAKTDAAETPAVVRQFEQMFVLGDPPDYEPRPETSIAARAARLGTTPEALAYDLMLEDEGRALLYVPVINFPNGSLDQVGSILQHEDVIPGLGDGGTNYGNHCDGSYSTFFLTHFVRNRGGVMSLAKAIRKLTRLGAETVGLLDRGLLAVGCKADINVIDFDRLSLRAPHVANDLPSGGRRLRQRAEGYCATIVSGIPVYRHGEASGALPGRLARGPCS